MLRASSSPSRAGSSSSPAARFACCWHAISAVAAPALRFGQGPHGKPFLVAEGGATIEFNVSHSTGRGLIALAHRPVGVDIEFLGRRADLDLVAKGVLTAAERAALEQREGAERVGLFYRLWTCKEALIKAKGTGFSTPPQSFAVPTALIEGAPSASFTFPGETVVWDVRDLGDRTHAAALAHA